MVYHALLVVEVLLITWSRGSGKTISRTSDGIILYSRRRVQGNGRTKNRMFAIFVPLHISSTSKRSRGIVELRKGVTRAHQRQSLNFAVGHPCRKTRGILTANKCCGIYEGREPLKIEVNNSSLYILADRTSFSILLEALKF
jgi:hypothetical protein